MRPKFFLIEPFAIYREGRRFFLYRFNPETGNYVLEGKYDHMVGNGEVSVFSRKDEDGFTVVFQEERVIHQINGQFLSISGDRVAFEEGEKMFSMGANLKRTPMTDDDFTDFESEGFC